MYIRIDRNGKVFKDTVPRLNDLVNIKIKNCSGKRIALIEVITPNAEHGGLEMQLAKLDSGSHHKIEMDATADHWKYYVAVVNVDDSLSEDRSEIKNEPEDKKITRLNVTFSSNKLQVNPERIFRNFL